MSAPDPDFNGTDTFQYNQGAVLVHGISVVPCDRWIVDRPDRYRDRGDVAVDGTDNSSVATVTITVNPVNDPPVGFDDAYAVAGLIERAVRRISRQARSQGIPIHIGIVVQQPWGCDRK